MRLFKRLHELSIHFIDTKELDSLVDLLILLQKIISQFTERIQFISTELLKIVFYGFEITFNHLTNNNLLEYNEFGVLFYGNIRLLCCSPSITTQFPSEIFQKFIFYLQYSPNLNYNSITIMSLESIKHLLEYIIINPEDNGWKQQIERSNMLLNDIIEFLLDFIISNSFDEEFLRYISDSVLSFIQFNQQILLNVLERLFSSRNCELVNNDNKDVVNITNEIINLEWIKQLRGLPSYKQQQQFEDLFRIFCIKLRGAIIIK